MATVAAVFTRGPWVRTPQQVVDSLFRTERKKDQKKTEGKEAVMREVLEEIQRLDPDTKKTRVALTDGERALQKLVDKKLRVFNTQGGPEAELWAKLACARILEGNVCQVVKGLRQTFTEQGLFGSKRKTLSEVAAYFDNNKHRMRYDEYLAQGLPIASGPVEGACKNLIKDRMEFILAETSTISGHSKDQERLYPQGRWAVVVT